MANYVGFRIDFGAPFEQGGLRLFFDTLRMAVEENWASQRDALTGPHSPGKELDIDALLTQVTPEKAKPGIERKGAVANDGWIPIVFSPLSTYCGLLTVGRSREGKLFASLHVCESEMRQDDDSRLQNRRRVEPGFEDPRFLPEPPQPEDPAAINDYIDRLEATQRENDRRHAQFYRDPSALWAKNAACLRHILECLVRALPVENSRMDQELVPEASQSAAPT